jgi:hypothetical protein
MYRKIMNDSDVDMLQVDLDRLRQWTVENGGGGINAGTRKAVIFARTLVKYSLN